ncbi:MAG: hypothetical protein AABW83_02280 [Nanoarchaeota archaeon]
MKSKKGMEMAINTVVILVISILVLVFLILFFTEAGSNFLSKIKGYSGYSNVDEVINNCNLYVDTEAQYSYCCDKKVVKYLENDKKIENKFTCLDINDKFGGVKGMSCGGVKCQ